jgi:hypothetical protein
MTDADALERLKNKNRPLVDSRDVSLTVTSASPSPDTSISRNLNNEILSSEDNQVSGKVDNENTRNEDIELSSKAQTIKQEQELQLELETKQSTLRLEIGLNDRLQTICREQGICREVLIEAMFEYCEANQKALSKVLNQAKQKNDYRQYIANKKRAKSMIERFG